MEILYILLNFHMKIPRLLNCKSHNSQGVNFSIVAQDNSTTLIHAWSWEKLFNSYEKKFFVCLFLLKVVNPERIHVS